MFRKEQCPASESFKFRCRSKKLKLVSELIDKGDVDEAVDYTKEKNYMFDKLAESIVSNDTIYQWRRIYVRDNKSKLCPTLTANMGTGGHNVPLILDSKKRIRSFI